MMEGSVQGAFSVIFLTGTGPLKMFWIIWIGIFLGRDWPKRRSLQASWLIVEINKVPLGCIHVVTLKQIGDHIHKELSLFALDSRYQRNGHGEKVLKQFICTMLEGSTLVAYCTKYSRPMQRLLRKVGFVRDPKSGYKLEKYGFIV